MRGTERVGGGSDREVVCVWVAQENIGSKSDHTPNVYRFLTRTVTQLCKAPLGAWLWSKLVLNYPWGERIKLSHYITFPW